MKKTIILLMTIPFFFSCQSEKKDDKLIKAKQMIQKIINNVEYADIGTITKKQLDSITLPLQDQLDSLKIEMTQSDLDSFEAFRQKIVSEMIDRKVVRDNK